MAAKRPKQSLPRHTWDWKFGIGLVIAILGLIPTVIGMRARPTVSLEAPLNREDVFTTPIVISNDGLMALDKVAVATFVGKSVYLGSGVQSDNIAEPYSPPNQTLEAGDKITVPLAEFLQFFDPIIYLDVALIVNYTPSYMPFWHKTKVFRFVTVKQADGDLRLQVQPPGDITERYEKTRQSLIPSS